jgi:hypothetical protein
MKCLIIVLLLSSCCSFAQADMKGTISGTIINQEEKPVAGVQLFVHKGDEIISSATTAKNGEFLTSKIDTGTYTVKTAHSFYKKTVITKLPVKKDTDTEIGLKIFQQLEPYDTIPVYASYNVVAVKPAQSIPSKPLATEVK